MWGIMKTKVSRCCLCLRFWGKPKTCVKCMQICEFLSFLLLKNQSPRASFGWHRHTALANARCCNPAPGTKPLLKSKAIYPALPQHWALPACRGAASQGCWHRRSRRCGVPLLTWRSSTALTYGHFLYPSEGLVLSRSVDRYLEPRLRIAIQTLGWVFTWTPSDSQTAWELYRKGGSGIVITVFSVNPKGGLSTRQNHGLFSSVQQR